MAESPTPLEQLFAEAGPESDGSANTSRPSSSARRSSSSNGGGRSRSSKKRKRKGLRRTLIVIGILVLLLGIIAGILYALLADTFNSIDRVSVEQDPSLKRPAATKVVSGKPPINILMLGSDSRETTDPNASAEDLKGFRSDAIMVAQISPDRDHVTVMSIMRDNWVNIQGVGDAKINAAVAHGGIPLAVNTVENFIDARIDYVALIDFESFKDLTDALGGVTVQNDIAYTAQNGGGDFTFDEGKITLDGDQALSFVRERYAFSDGDYQRARNQQAYIKGAMKKLLSKETLGNVGRLTSTFESLKPHLILSESLSMPKAVSLGFSMRDIRADDVDFFTSPTKGTGTSADGQSIVIPDDESLKQVRTAFKTGTLDEYLAKQKSEGTLTE